MAVINTGLLTKGVRSNFFAAFDAAQKLAHWERFCMRIPSNASLEQYRWLGAVPKMRQWTDKRTIIPLSTESYDITNLDYEATMEVDRNEMADDQTGQISQRARGLGEKAGLHKDYLLFALMMDGTSGTSYDGAAFFSASHTIKLPGQTATTQTNLSGLDISTVDSARDVVTNPTVIQAKAAIQAASAVLMAQLDDQGDPVNLTPGGWIICCTPTMYWTFKEAVSATVVANSSNIMMGAADVIGTPYWTDTDAFGLFKTDGLTVKPFLFQEREPLIFQALEANSETGFMTRKYLYGVHARYRLAYAEHRCATLCTLT